MKRRSDIDAYEFARIWNAARSVGEVARLTGLRPSACRARACRYRSVAYLKAMKPGPRIDAARLRRAAGNPS